MKNDQFKYSTLALLLAAALTACGGGGGEPGAVNPGTGSGTTPGTGTGTTPGTGTTTPTPTPTPSEEAPAPKPTVTLTFVDASGKAVTSLSGGQTANVSAKVLDADGKPAVGAIVKFTADGGSATSLVTFTPESGSALTDKDGIAVIAVRPSSTTASGATGIVATSVIGGETATITSNIAVGAAPLTIGKLTFTPTPTTALPAFSTLSLSFPVSSGGAAPSAVAGLTMTSLCSGDGTASLVAGTYANGVQSATYTNNGCLRGTDIITVSIGSSSQTISVGVSPANIGSIRFVGSSVGSNSIVLRGSGGQGRSEAAQLTFQVVDQHNNGLAGVDVDFSATTYTGGLSVSPMRATSDAAGNVTTMVSSGSIPTPVRVSAEASRNGIKLSGLSDALSVSTGLPIQKSMSMSAEKFNIEGLDYDGISTGVTVRLADQYGNPVSDGTTVNFVTEGGSIGSSAAGACQTGADGACTVQLRSQAFKPVNGRVTVLAYVQGLEDFVDENGDGQYTCKTWGGPAAYRPLVDTCPKGEGEAYTDMGDPFLDADWDGVYNAQAGDRPIPYNRVAYSDKGDEKWGLNYIRRTFEITFSGSTPTIVRQWRNASGDYVDWTAANGAPDEIDGVSACKATVLSFRMYDRNRNPMPFGTTVSMSDAVAVTGNALPGSVASTNEIGGTLHHLTVRPSNTSDCKPGSFTLNITTPQGNQTGFPFTVN